MTRRALGLLLVVCLILSCSAVGLAKPPADKGSPGNGHGGWRHQFQDMGEATWAEHSVNKWALRDCIKGRSETEFAPNQPVKQAEALAMILRALGYEDEAGEWADKIVAGEETLPFPNAKSFPEWTFGYVAMAVEAGLIPAEGAFQAEKAASRAWVTAILIGTLGLEEDDLADYEDADLDFADASDIDPELLAAIARALDEGLLIGYPDNTLQPNKPVTRAEMAVLLDRLGGELEPGEGVIRGKLLDCTLASGDEPATLYIMKDDKSKVLIEVSPDAAVFIDGEEAALEDLEAGVRVEVTLDEEGAALLIEAGTTEEVTGIVEAVETGDDPSITVELEDEEGETGDTATYPVADGVVVRMRGHEVDLEAVLVGDRVSMRVVGGEVVRIVIEDVAVTEAVGYFVRVVVATSDEPAAIVIEPLEGDDAGDEVSYDCRDLLELAVLLRGEQVGYDALEPGDLVELKIERGLVVRVVIEEREEYEVSGTVIDVDVADPATICIESDDTELSFDVSPDVVVRLGHDDDLTLSDVLVGDEVELTLAGGTTDDPGAVILIVIEEREETEVEGTISALDIEDMTITVVVDEEERSFTIADGATVRYGDEALTLEDLQVGDEVELTLADGEATAIAIEERAAEDDEEEEDQD